MHGSPTAPRPRGCSRCLRLLYVGDNAWTTMTPASRVGLDLSVTRFVEPVLLCDECGRRLP